MEPLGTVEESELGRWPELLGAVDDPELLGPDDDPELLGAVEEPVVPELDFELLGAVVEPELIEPEEVVTPPVLELPDAVLLLEPQIQLLHPPLDLELEVGAGVVPLLLECEDGEAPVEVEKPVLDDPWPELLDLWPELLGAWPLEPWVLEPWVLEPCPELLGA